MNEYTVILTINTSATQIQRKMTGYTVEEAKAKIRENVSEMAEANGISGEFVLEMIVIENGEYFDSDVATANYTNGVLTIEA